MGGINVNSHNVNSNLNLKLNNGNTNTYSFNSVKMNSDDSLTSYDIDYSIGNVFEDKTIMSFLYKKYIEENIGTERFNTSDSGIKDIVGVVKKGVDYRTDKKGIIHDLKYIPSDAQKYGIMMADEYKEILQKQYNETGDEKIKEMYSDKNIKLKEEEFTKFFKEKSDEYRLWDNEYNKLLSQMQKEAASLTDDAEIAALNSKYSAQLEEIAKQRENCLKSIAGPDRDYNKVEIEDKYFGNTKSELISYGSKSAMTGVTTFLMSTGSDILTEALTNYKNGYSLSESFKMAFDNTDYKKNAITSSSQAGSMFITSVLTKGNSSAASAAGTVAFNLTDFIYKYETAKTQEEKDKLLDEELGKTSFTTWAAALSCATPVISGVTASTCAETTWTVFDWFYKYDSLGEWANSEDYRDVCGMFMGTSGALFGDATAAKTSGKSTGLLATIFKMGFTWVGRNILADPIHNLGIRWYDFKNGIRMKNAIEDMFDQALYPNNPKTIRPSEKYVIAGTVEEMALKMIEEQKAQAAQNTQQGTTNN